METRYACLNLKNLSQVTVIYSNEDEVTETGLPTVLNPDHWEHYAQLDGISLEQVKSMGEQEAQTEIRILTLEEAVVEQEYLIEQSAGIDIPIAIYPAEHPGDSDRFVVLTREEADKHEATFEKNAWMVDWINPEAVKEFVKDSNFQKVSLEDALAGFSTLKH